MERVPRTPRPDWPARLEARGFPLQPADGRYWDESACYQFTEQEILELEKATGVLHTLTLDAVDFAIASGSWWERLRIGESMVPAIRRSWEACQGQGAPSLYGRMDLAWLGEGPPKLLEYNADTPTALIEAAVVQWDWLQEAEPTAGQFNSIHERLVQGWRDLAPWLEAGPVHFASGEDTDDILTTTYLQDTAAQAGLSTRYINIPDIGWDGRRFVDLQGNPILTCFKLYPWEWMVADDFGAHALAGGTTWIEPAWKAVVSSKAFLALLWERNPAHPNLLRTTLDEPGPGMRSYARKPIRGREGSGVTLVQAGQLLAEERQGEYGAEGYVFQELFDFRGGFGGLTPVLGSWVIQGEPAGLGIRESGTPITTNTSPFLPHLFHRGTP